MPIYQKCPKEVVDLANALLCEFETHKPLLDAKIRIDYMFAFAKEDDLGNPIGHALTLRGTRALGIAKKMNLKQRAKGMGDVEITLDGDWWHTASQGERRAVLDHELHHFSIKTKGDGTTATDDLSRPKIVLRPHDYDIGWFAIIAARHGINSIERQQARQMADNHGQYFWPEFTKN